jgi:hypothetical protein
MVRSVAVKFSRSAPIRRTSSQVVAVQNPPQRAECATGQVARSRRCSANGSACTAGSAGSQSETGPLPAP